MTATATSSGTFAIGSELTVHRLGFGAMRISGDGVWDRRATTTPHGGLSVVSVEEVAAAREIVPIATVQKPGTSAPPRCGLTPEEVAELDGAGDV